MPQHHETQQVWVHVGQVAWVASIVFSSSALEDFMRRINLDVEPLLGHFCEDHNRVERWAMRGFFKAPCVHRPRHAVPVPESAVLLAKVIWTVLASLATLSFFQQSDQWTVSLICNVARGGFGFRAIREKEQMNLTGS
jgi:hypothetical protein